MSIPSTTRPQQPLDSRAARGGGGDSRCSLGLLSSFWVCSGFIYPCGDGGVVSYSVLPHPAFRFLPPPYVVQPGLTFNFICGVYIGAQSVQSGRAGRLIGLLCVCYRSLGTVYLTRSSGAHFPISALEGRPGTHLSVQLRPSHRSRSPSAYSMRGRLPRLFCHPGQSSQHAMAPSTPSSFTGSLFAWRPLWVGSAGLTLFPGVLPHALRVVERIWRRGHSRCRLMRFGVGSRSPLFCPGLFSRPRVIGRIR